jgi:hypothetical protein
MKTLHRMALACAMTAAASAASAATTLTFEGLSPTIYADGESFSDGAANFSVQGDGLAGALINGSDPGSCELLLCPKGNSSHYYLGLNDGSLTLSAAGGFRLNGLDFGFVVPSGGLNGDLSVGMLQITGTDASGRVSTIAKRFSPTDANGDYNFSRWNIGGQFGQIEFSSVRFNACLFDADEVCTSLALNQAQFALDNIAITTAVPEPSSWLLMGLGLAAVGQLSRRRLR